MNLEESKLEIISRRLFYHIVVYKHERDMLRMLDIELFQGRILEVFVPEYRSQTASEKESALREYLKTIQDNYDEAEMLLQDKEGYFNAGVAYGKLEQEQPDDDDDTWKRKKKKKEQFKTDFYKFQLKSAKDRKAIEKNSENGDSDEESSDGLPPAANMDSDSKEDFNDQIEDPEYLKKRKQNLAASFQQQLAELNNKKLKTL